MKIYYLSYNNINNHYYLDQGVFWKNRDDFGSISDFGTLEKKLKKTIIFHRNSELYVDENFPKLFREFLRELFIKSKVRVIFNINIRKFNKY